MQTNANAVVSSAKQDFPSQTSALESSVTTPLELGQGAALGPDGPAATSDRGGDRQHRLSCGQLQERHQLGLRGTRPVVVPPVGDRYDTGRIEAYSDGVFSIAATLLVIELAVPAADFHHLWKGIADQWPSYLSYATSFLTVSGIWLVHHAMFRRLRFADSIVTRLNLLLLMAVAFLPFPTKLVAEALDSGSAERTAVLFYGATLLVISVLVTVIVRYAGSRPDLIEEDGRDQVVALAAQATPNLGFYVGVLALALLAPKVAAFGFLAIAVFAILHVRAGRR